MVFLLVSACSSDDELLSSPSTTRLQRYISTPSSTSSASSPNTIVASSTTTDPPPAPGTQPSALAPPDALFPTTSTEPAVTLPAARPSVARTSPTSAAPRIVTTRPPAVLTTATGVGDSVMLAAQGELTVAGVDVDAMKNRTFDQGLEVL